MCNAAQKLTVVSPLRKQDFESDQEVRWCPGCGDYSILAAVQRALAELPVPREQHVFISGIGCSSRFPYYMNTYGFHSIHGRAPAIASGLKISRPELSVWVITGDGDGLSIGGNHLIHTLRRNMDLKILLFNNRIYGLTKGQYSPTSEVGKVTKSTPFGSLDHPINPIGLALSAGATFVARALDVDAKGLGEIIKAAWRHKGSAFVEIYQNCNVFNDGAHAHLSDRQTKMETVLPLADGQPLKFGKEQPRGIKLDGFTPQVVPLDDGADLLKHDSSNLPLAHLLASLEHPEFPVPFGIFYRTERPTYDAMIRGQVAEHSAARSGDLTALLHSGETWRVE